MPYRALGERIGQIASPEVVKVAMTCLLLAPSPPLLFMGEEFGADTPFLFFCDFGPELAAKVTQGRRSEFAKFAAFSSDQARGRIPDPNSRNTFLASKLNWYSLDNSEHSQWLQFYTGLLAWRREHIIPRIDDIKTGEKTVDILDEKAVSVRWPFVRGGALKLFANFSDHEISITELKDNKLPAFSAVWLLQE